VKLAEAESWFARFGRFADVVEEYRDRSSLPSEPAGDLPEVATLNYGLLLHLDGRSQEAAWWLRYTSVLLARPVYYDSKAKTLGHDPTPGARLMKPSKDDELRKRVVESALAKLESPPADTP
jgi:hypothetical protein